jgi:hypothetical protein
MNRTQLESIRIQNLRKVELLTYRPKLNAIEIAPNNSFSHEFAKFTAAWLIRKGLPSNQLPDFFEIARNALPMEALEDFIRKNRLEFEYEWLRPEIITECRMRDQGRWDIFILDTGERVEIVRTNERARKPYDDKTVIIKI